LFLFLILIILIILSKIGFERSYQHGSAETGFWEVVCNKRPIG
jgi:hypothetical protein